VYLNATEVVKLIARGELGAHDYALQLIQHNRAMSSLGAITWIDETRVLAAARSVDEHLQQGKKAHALSGLPIIVKDNIDLAGVITTAGTACFNGNIRRSTAPALQRLLESGAIVFAKSNMHELAAGGTSSNPLTGAVANPYDRTRVAGGSSGGTAAAVSAGIVPAGLGTDTCGSIRVPAALCGVVGLRPSTLAGRRYPMEGVLPLASEVDTVGPSARTVADVALLHTAITGETIPAVPQVSALRIGVARDPYWKDLDPEVSQVAERALTRLEESGTIVVDVHVDGYYALATQIYATLFVAGLKESLLMYPKLSNAGQDVEGVIGAIRSRDAKVLFERAYRMKLSAAQVHEARESSRKRVVAAYREMFLGNKLDAIAFPTVPMAAPLINIHGDTATDEIEINGKKVPKGTTWIRNTGVTCALGAPGLSIPAGLTSQGLPVGIELDGLPGEDAALLALGMAIEQVWPPIPRPIVTDPRQI
jgi:mandelamide amidase